MEPFGMLLLISVCPFVNSPDYLSKADMRVYVCMYTFMQSLNHTCRQLQIAE